MVIEKILKQLTPERVKKEVEKVYRTKLPPVLHKWVDEYQKVGDRPYFNWPWIYIVTKTIIFPSTIPKYRKPLWTIKTLIFMFNILLDDVADRTQNEKLLENLINITHGKTTLNSEGLSNLEKKYFKFAVRLWKHIKKTISRYPRHEEFKSLFDYDNEQYLNAMNYAYLINKNHYLINKTESWLYISHGMQVFPIMDVDLMCSRIDKKLLGVMREIVWNFQRMARVGNWVSTWEREIKDGDFTSGIWVYALDRGIIKINDLSRDNEKFLIDRIKKGGVEKLLLREWERCYKEILKLGRKIGRKDLEREIKVFLTSIEKLIFLHLSSRYHK